MVAEKVELMSVRMEISRSDRGKVIADAVAILD